jgi:hypothetical protein
MSSTPRGSALNSQCKGLISGLQNAGQLHTAQKKGKGMIRARQLGALLLLAHVAFAQTATNIPAAPTVTNMSVSGQDTEVRIDVSATAVVTSAKVTAAYGDRISLDLPGVVYNMTPRRILVNKNCVHAVRIWQQSETPPLTRMLIELDRATPYLLSSEGNSVVLRIGAHLQDKEQRASTEPARPTRRQDVPAPTGRTSTAVSAAQAVIGVFKRPEKPTLTSQTENVPPIQPAPQSLPPLQIGKVQEPAAPAVEPIKEANPSIAVMTENPAPKAAEQPIVPQPPVLVVSAPSASEVTAGSSSLPLSSAASVSPAPPPAPKPATPAPAAVPVEPLALVPTPTPAPQPGTPSPVDVTIEPPAPAPEPATIAPTAVPAEAATPAMAAVESPKPARDISESEMRALTETVNTGMRTVFHVKHVQQETAYLDGGRSAGLSEGMTLVIKDETKAAAKDETGGSAGGPVAELVVIGVAETSAVTEIHTPKRDVVPGDLAFLSSEDRQALVDQRTMGATRKYPAVITFTESDLLDDEARAFVPRPPLPSVNRMRGLIGLDYMDTVNRDTSQSRSSEIGAIFRADFTRIGGTYWNLSGYWRGRLNSFSASTQPTLQDLLNRTYHLDLTYQNPNSRWVAGVGRMYLPWASSLNTLDGGYFGARIGKITTIGIFGGSTPDPTSWNYNPNQKMGGTFVNFGGGSYESLHFSSTSGVGVNLLKWQMQDPFIFFENNITYKRTFSIYHSLQADRPQGNPAVPSPSPGISQSFLTVRLAPVQRFEISLNDTYFRNIPTFDPTLIGTGLLDQYLFQGVSAGARVEVLKPISLYAQLGESSRTGDAKRSINQLYGLSFVKVPWLGVNADLHYSKFASSFAVGTYRAVSLSRTFGDRIHINVLGGDQSVLSALAGNQTARFLTATSDTSIGARFFMQGGLTFYRGQLQNYDQWSFTLGYRFDSKGNHR